MLNFINSKQNKNILKEIHSLYESSFPADEKVPYFILKQKAKKDISDIIGIYDHEEFIGFVILVFDKDIVFLWYLAIQEDKRNKGYGSFILQVLKNKYSDKRIILNVEEVKTEKQLKRKQFYIKNGFLDCGFKTMEYGVIYEMLYMNDKVSCDEYLDMMRKYSIPALVDKNYKLYSTSE